MKATRPTKAVMQLLWLSLLLRTVNGIYIPVEKFDEQTDMLETTTPINTNEVTDIITSVYTIESTTNLTDITTANSVTTTGVVSNTSKPRITLPMPPCSSVCKYKRVEGDAECQHQSLTNIPSECTEAVRLDARHNDITFLDKLSLVGYKNLRSLYMGMNGLASIGPNTFVATPKLRELFVNSHKLVIVQRKAFNGIRHDLRALYLTRGNIKVIEQHVFDNLSGLQRLLLSRNELNWLPRDLFHRLTNLQILNLAHNKLTTIHRSMFRDLHHLVYLDVSYNYLRVLPHGLLKHNINLSYFLASNNLIDTVEQKSIYTRSDFGVIEETAVTIQESRHYQNIFPHKVNLTNNNISSLKNLSNLQFVPELYLINNPIDCDCHAIWAWNWTREFNNGNDQQAITCRTPNHIVNQTMTSLRKDNLTCDVAINGITPLTSFSGQITLLTVTLINILAMVY